MLRVSPGRLRHRVAVERADPASPRDSAGQVLTEWLLVADVWAAVEPLSVQEAMIASQQQATTTHRITTHWSPELAAIDAAHRVRFGERIFILDGAPTNTEERNIEIVMMATEMRPRE